MRSKLQHILLLSLSVFLVLPAAAQQDVYRAASVLLRKQVLAEAEWALKQSPVTVTAERSPLSAGGKHDFFSQADYFWPNPAKPDGPYINKDGETNPDNFVAHRKAMIRLSKIIGALASAYKLTGDKRYVKPAEMHLDAWFANPDTKMNPDLRYAQAVIGQSTGRSWGIIDAIHLMEVAQGMTVLEKAPQFNAAIKKGVKTWFAAFINWMDTSKPGIAERDSKNNHSTCWVMQVASFSKLVGDEAMLDSCRKRFKTILLPRQMAADGSFPLELERTKPYGYSIFNLDAMAAICQILSTGKDNLWTFETPDGRSVKKAIAWLHPFIADKKSWTYPQDVMFWENWPVAQPFLIFGAQALNEPRYFETWKKLDHQPSNAEVVRNLPIRNPLIWM